MPYQSAAQQRLFFSKASPVGRKKAEEWARETDFEGLPERVEDEEEKESKAHEKGESARAERAEHRKVHDRRTATGKAAAMAAAMKALRQSMKRRAR